jgi:heptosyltransferase-2
LTVRAASLYDSADDVSEPERILISIPNWVGDVVMATAALRAVRQRFATARIVHLMRPYVADVLAGTAFCDEAIFWPAHGGGRRGGDTKESRNNNWCVFFAKRQAKSGVLNVSRSGYSRATPNHQAGGGDAGETPSHRLEAGATTTGVLDLVRRLRRGRFDLAILLTNSFRSALVTRLAGVRRRVGYARDGRGWLLTDRLDAPRKDGRFVPIPALDYYNALARHVGCEDPGDKLELATLPADEAAIERRLACGYRRDACATPQPRAAVPQSQPRAAVPHGEPLVVLNPGANYGSAKCWPPEYYAQLADALVERFGARVVASLGPKEREIADRLAAAARRPIDIFVDPPLGLGPLKALIRRCDLLITNDTGPRHFAAAFGVPVVTIFGSSDPAWTETRFAKERMVMLKLDCQPCMERTCPLKHHDCMRRLLPAMVLEKAEELLAKQPVDAVG